MRCPQSFAAGTLTTVLLVPASVFAQGTPSPAQGAQAAVAGATLEEITVTSRRRSESLSDVPVAINALSPETIEERNIINAQLAWTHGNIVTTFWATNLTDERYIAAINSGLRFAGPPRQFGVRVLKAF